MAYEIFWIVRHRVLYIRETGGVPLDDIGEVTRKVADLMDDASTTANALVVAIIDLRESKFEVAVQIVASGIDEIAAASDSRIWKARPDFVVLIANDEAARFITSVVINLSKQPMTTVGTLDEALLVVRYMYPELEPQLQEYAEGASSSGAPG